MSNTKQSVHNNKSSSTDQSQSQRRTNSPEAHTDTLWVPHCVASCTHTHRRTHTHTQDHLTDDENVWCLRRVILCTQEERIKSDQLIITARHRVRQKSNKAPAVFFQAGLDATSLTFFFFSANTSRPFSFLLCRYKRWPKLC